MNKYDEIEIPYGSPMYIMAKPVGAHCNLQCRYCYYLEKSNLCDNATPYMSDETLELFIEQYIKSQTTPEVMFIWHGGEPLLRPISFYERALELQQRYADGHHIDNCIQTNATLIDERWCDFFRRHNILVGVSIDGPQHMHDTLRTTRHGEGSFRNVLRGIDLLNKYHIAWNAMATVNAANVEYPREFYRFFHDELRCRYLQFTPIVERLSATNTLMHGAEDGGTLTAESITASQWGTFLCTIFDEWVHNDVGEMFVQLFDTTLANWVGAPSGICTMSKYCGHAATIEHNGDVYSCDHFVFPEYRLGNIHDTPIINIMYSHQQRAFGRAKYTTLPGQCKRCKFLFACYGECPRNRFLTTADGEKGLNYLCEGYHTFFAHTAEAMDYMREQLEQGLAPKNVMQWLKNNKP